MSLRGVMTPASLGVMTRSAQDKPLKEFCICGRGFTTSSGAKHHYAVCLQEQARSAAYVARIESQARR